MKPFLTYEEQLDKLKSNGLIIDDESAAIDYLRWEGYYNVINGYSPCFKVNGKFIKGTTFDNIRRLYDFDKDLRAITYKYISSIEAHIKALIAHEFSRAHGVDEKTYLQKSCFSNNQKSLEAVERLIEECQAVIKDATTKNSNKYREYIAHNFNEHNHVPLWILIRSLTFGTVSIFYKNMKDEEKEVIARQYYLSSIQLANMLEVVVSFRNIVAHGERTFCAKLPKTRLSTELGITKKLSIAKNDKGANKYGRSDFLALLISCKYLLPPIEFSGFIFELQARITRLEKHFPLPMMGKIKTLMGLKGNYLQLLTKLKIN